MMGGGKDREWLTPLTPEGNRDTDDPDLDNMVGCHTGPYIHLNIIDPQPGFEYCWKRNKGRDKLLALQTGWRPVGDNDPEMAAMNKIMTDSPGSLDSSDVYGDVILMKAPAEAIRRIRDREQQAAKAQMRSGAEDFADRASAIEQQLSRGFPSRFARRDHGLEYRDAKDQTVDHWRPEDGIIREG